MNSSKRLKVAVAPFPKVLDIHLLENGELGIAGYEGKFLLIILKELGLDYEFVIPEDREIGIVKLDGNSTGLIKMILMEEVDLAFSAISVVEERWNAVKMSKGYYVYETCVNSFNPGNLNPAFSFIYPFDFTMLISLFIVLIITSFVLTKLRGRNHSIFGTLFELIAIMLRQPLPAAKSTPDANILILFWLIYAFVISSSYSATLLSFLTKPLQGTPIRTIHELSTAVQTGTHQIYVLPVYVPFLLKSEERHLRQLGEIILRNNWIIGSDNISSMHYITHHSSQILPRIVAKLYFGTREDVYISSETIFSRSVAFAYSKHFCCISKLNWILTKLSGSGILEKLLRDVSLKIYLKSQNKTVIDESHSLHLTDLTGVFMLLAVGCAFSVIALFGEIVFSRVYRKIRI
ncbi:glutamate receptor ionotropic, delta-1 [Nephila pilipes]|uniref:Glutamate receptor ionotropic, delta-1 n=1 Tax=Nephila pilipes TaxID=299642 RepID=A0A8X6PA79_NEPPI|nr:glutamate receptor ionotropic, delta-1 [Nephila pilipes]